MTSTVNTGYDLYALLAASGFDDKYSRFIVAQAAHESANFDSLVFRSNNNPFGIKYRPGKSIAEGEKLGYAHYKNMGQAVTDYRRIFYGYGIVIGLATLANFVNLLKKHKYFEATEEEYLKGCTWFYNLYFPEGWEKKKPAGASGSW